MATEAAVEIDYPSSDGEPMAETTIHARAMILLQQALEDFFGQRKDVFIAVDLFWYYDEGQRTKKVAPDVMVVFNVANHDRRTFLAWDEGGNVPSIIIEVTSRDTKEDDEFDKYWLYEGLGVQEYFVFDPEAETRKAALQGYRLNGAAYRRLRPKDGCIASQFGFELFPEGNLLRLVDSKSGATIPTRSEAIAAEKEQSLKLRSEVERLQAMLQKYGQSPGNGP